MICYTKQKFSSKVCSENKQLTIKLPMPSGYINISKNQYIINVCTQNKKQFSTISKSSLLKLLIDHF